MYCEIPKLTRCCCCLPLRIGLIVFGYLNLALSLVIVGLLSRYISNGGKPTVMALYHGLPMYSYFSIPLTLYAVDAVFSMVLIVGAHMKNVIILKVFFYYGIMTTVATLVAFFTLLEYSYLSLIFEGAACMFCGLIVQVYLLLLLWSELFKLDNRQQNRFVNNVEMPPDAVEIVLDDNKYTDI